MQKQANRGAQSTSQLATQAILATNRNCRFLAGAHIRYCWRTSPPAQQPAQTVRGFAKGRISPSVQDMHSTPSQKPGCHQTHALRSFGSAAHHNPSSHHHQLSQRSNTCFTTTHTTGQATTKRHTHRHHHPHASTLLPPTQTSNGDVHFKDSSAHGGPGGRQHPHEALPVTWPSSGWPVGAVVQQTSCCQLLRQK